MAEPQSPVDPDALPAVDPAELEDQSAARVAAQWARMPPAWSGCDRTLIRSTEYLLFAIGIAFTLMITLEVISRFVFSFSISFVNAAARMLLVWFFLLGAGVALRRGAHVGFDLLLSALPPRGRRALTLVGLACTAAFCLEMIWSGWYSLGPAWRQTEPGLDVSIVWVVVALPLGFLLLLYHAVVLAWLELHAPHEQAAP
jgi:TRAP-type transport system small permease protein